jgi:L-ribulose-5-phosphate 3-epimerase
MYIRSVFEKYGVDCAVLGCYKNLAHPDPEALKKIQDEYRAHIRFASLLNAGVVGTETGCPNAEYKTCPENKTDESLNIFIKNLIPVVEYAEKMGVILAIEPVVRHIVYDPKAARKVLDAIPSPNLGIIFDPVNLLEYYNYKDQKDICNEAIELLNEDIMMIHIKDFTPAEDHLNSMAAGLGMMDYTDIMKFVKKHKPFIHMTLEDTKPDNAVAARKHMEKLFDEA